MTRDPYYPPTAGAPGAGPTYGHNYQSNAMRSPQYYTDNSARTRYHRHRHHWWYVWIPAAAALMWFGTVLALLITWLAQGRPHYVSMSPGQKIAYISDVAADILKPLFITGCTITAIGFFLSLSVERWLRHEGRLLPNMRRREKVMSTLAIISSFGGGAGLILLSIFDTKRHMKLHRVFLLIFVLGTALSAIFTVVEFRWLNKEFGADVRRLRFSYLTKAVFAFVLIVLAVAFGATLGSSHQNVAAVLEWTISFGFTLYLLTFWWDLRQSRGFEKGDLSPTRLMENGVGASNGNAHGGGRAMRQVPPAAM